MGYQSALEAAGAEVHAYDSFGDYQGTWIAKVTYNGETGWVEGSYGSCSGCDAFEGEFGYSYNDDDKDYQERLAEFGRSYLTCVTPQEQQVAYYERQVADSSSWYAEEAQQMLEYVKANG
jgi:hypothetical protein